MTDDDGLMWLSLFEAAMRLGKSAADAAKDQAGLLTIGLAEHAVAEMKLCVAVLEQIGANSESVESIRTWIAAMERRLDAAS